MERCIQYFGYASKVLDSMENWRGIQGATDVMKAGRITLSTTHTALDNLSCPAKTPQQRHLQLRQAQARQEKYKAEVRNKPGLKTGAVTIARRFKFNMVGAQVCLQIHTHLKSSSTMSC